jgi:Ulp1 family protease
MLFYKRVSFVTTLLDDDDDADDVEKTIITANTTATRRSTTKTNEKCKQLLHYEQLNRNNAQFPFRPKSIITLAQFKCLQPEKWLNDAVLNGYIELLQKRDNRLVSQNSNRQPTLFINSWLMAKANNQPGQNYQLIKRFTKKHDIFTKKAIPIVIHIPGHWLLASVFIQAKCIQYYNSINNHDMMAANNPILDQLFECTTLEHWII